MIGPTLWNVLYDDLLTSEMPVGVKLVGFPNDLVMTATAKSEIILSSLVNKLGGI